MPNIGRPHGIQKSGRLKGVVDIRVRIRVELLLAIAVAVAAGFFLHH